MKSNIIADIIENLDDNQCSNKKYTIKIKNKFKIYNVFLFFY